MKLRCKRVHDVFATPTPPKKTSLGEDASFVVLSTSKYISVKVGAGDMSVGESKNQQTIANFRLRHIY